MKAIVEFHREDLDGIIRVHLEEHGYQIPPEEKINWKSRPTMHATIAVESGSVSADDTTWRDTACAILHRLAVGAQLRGYHGIEKQLETIAAALDKGDKSMSPAEIGLTQTNAPRAAAPVDPVKFKQDTEDIEKLIQQSRQLMKGEANEDPREEK